MAHVRFPPLRPVSRTSSPSIWNSVPPMGGMPLKDATAREAAAAVIAPFRDVTPSCTGVPAVATTTLPTLKGVDMWLAHPSFGRASQP
jgi:hypothetical protein